ncbi:MAG: hypothetical protein KDE27_21420 [Planctomycetes bacterium]|nr:hypothetical protein [Planctomycetota bacterium]
MSKPSPDHHDAELILKFYDLRREAVMRESRDTIIGQCWPRSLDDALAITRPEHPHNRPFRQVATYWEMVYGMAKYGVVNTDFLLESNAEGLFVYARFEPYIAAMREQYNPRVFEKAEWISSQGPLAEKLMTSFRKRIKAKLESL